MHMRVRVRVCVTNNEQEDGKLRLNLANGSKVWCRKGKCHTLTKQHQHQQQQITSNHNKRYKSRPMSQALCGDGGNIQVNAINHKAQTCMFHIYAAGMWAQSVKMSHCGGSHCKRWDWDNTFVAFAKATGANILLFAFLPQPRSSSHNSRLFLLQSIFIFLTFDEIATTTIIPVWWCSQWHSKVTLSTMNDGRAWMRVIRISTVKCAR